jgi:hypothetical protein
MEKKQYKNIYQKLLVIQQAVMGLGKDKAAFNYKYVTGDKVLGIIKPLMNDLGLLLKQEVLDIENTRQDYTTNQGSKTEILSKLMMRFTWVDTDTMQTDVNLFGANGQNGFDKGVGSSITYAERYFLLKYFHIATDEDDIDNPDSKKDVKTVAPAPPKAVTPTAIKPSTTFQTDDRKVKALKALQGVKTLSTVKGLIDAQKSFKDANSSVSFVAGATIEDVVKLNDIEVILSFYNSVK